MTEFPDVLIIIVLVVVVLLIVGSVAIFLFPIVSQFWRNPGASRYEEPREQAANDRIPAELTDSSNVTTELEVKWNKGMNKEQLRLAVRKDLEILDTVDESVWSDKEMVLAAVKGCGEAVSYLPDELRADEEVLLTSLDSDDPWDDWDDFEMFMVTHFYAKEVRSDRIVSRLEELALAYFNAGSEHLYNPTNDPEMYDSNGNYVGRDLRHLSDLYETELDDIPNFLVDDCMKRKHISEK